MAVGRNTVAYHAGAHWGIRHRIRAWLLAGHAPAFDRVLRDRKRRLLSGMSGTVIEIGPGTGSNLRYLPSNVKWIGVEPNRFMHRHALAAVERAGISGRIVTGHAECIPAATGSIDAVIGTLILCSVRNPVVVLREIRRVLKPGGRYAFMEHVAAAPGTWLRCVQRLVRPLWRLLGDGCSPDRDLGSLIEEAGFEHVAYETFQLDGSPRVTSRHIAGQATGGSWNEAASPLGS
jgi:SAM-dependent methyltransferase